jgi:hypothetical protein
MPAVRAVNLRTIYFCVRGSRPAKWMLYIVFAIAILIALFIMPAFYIL